MADSITFEKKVVADIIRDISTTSWQTLRTVWYVYMSDNPSKKSRQTLINTYRIVKREQKAVWQTL